MIYLDTHILVWLYLGDPAKLSDNAKDAINSHSLKISPMAYLELVYLYEIGRLKTKPDVVVNYLMNTIDLKICDLSFEAVVNSSAKQMWTRDPFDSGSCGAGTIRAGYKR